MSESQISVHVSILMIPAKQEYLAWVFELQCEEQAQNFQTLASTINIVTQEDVVEVGDVARLLRCLPDVKEAH